MRRTVLIVVAILLGGVAGSRRFCRSGMLVIEHIEKPSGN
jgi:hypothetical protein